MEAVEAVQPVQARLVRQLLQPSSQEPLFAGQLFLVHGVLALALLQALQAQLLHMRYCSFTHYQFLEMESWSAPNGARYQLSSNFN